MKKNYKKYIIFMTLIITFLLMLILNSKTLMVSDDYAYQFLFAGRTPSANTKPISNLFEIITSMINHWKLWGGRITPHFLLQLAFMIGINFFNIVNALMFVFLGLLIYKHVNNSKESRPFLLILIYAITFLLAPQPGSTLMWKSGSANYLWSAVLILIMTLIYKKHDDFNNIKDNNINMFLLFLFGLVVGCCNENSGCALIITQMIFIFVYKYKYKRIPRWSISGLAGTIIGYIILIASPGNYIRALLMYDSKTFKIEEIFKDFLQLSALSYTYLRAIIILTVITTVIIYKKQNKFIDVISKYHQQIIFLLFSTISIYSLVVSPAYPERCWFFAFIYFVIVIGMNINKLDISNIQYQKVLAILIIVISISAFNEYSKAYNNIDDSYILLKEQIKQIEIQKKAGKKDIVVNTVYTHVGKYNAFLENGYLTSDKDGWFNKWMAKYYDVDSITAVD